MQSKLKKVALVTGANKGIGFEVARQLAASGYSVLLGARHRAPGEEAAATLKREGRDVRYLSIDLDDPATIAAAVRDIDAPTSYGTEAWIRQRSMPRWRFLGSQRLRSLGREVRHEMAHNNRAGRGVSGISGSSGKGSEELRAQPERSFGRDPLLLAFCRS